MINEFANRQNMHLAVIALLDQPEHQPSTISTCCWKPRSRTWRQG